MNRLPLTLLLAWILTIAVSGWLLGGLVSERVALDAQASARVDTLARLVGEHADSIMDATELMLDTVLVAPSTRLAAMRERDAVEDTHELLENAAARTAAVDNLFLADVSGEVVTSSSRRRQAGSIAHESYFRELLQDPSERSVAVTVRGRSTGRWGLVLARPLVDESGSFGGVLAAHIGLERTFLSLYRDIGIDPRITISVWNPHGTLLLRQPFDDALIGTRADDPLLRELVARNQFALTRLDRPSPEAAERMTSVLRIQRHPLIVGVSESRQDYMALWHDAVWRTLLAVAAMIGGCVLLTRNARLHHRSYLRLKRVIDAAPHGIIFFERDGSGAPSAFMANKTARQQLSLAGDLPAGDEIDALSLAEPVTAATSEGERRSLCLLRKADGRPTRPLEVFLFGAGKGDAAMLIEDTSARLQAEGALRAALVRSRAALEESGHGVRDWNIVTGELSFSSSWLRQLGYAEGELANELAQWQCLLHPADRSACDERIGRHLGGLSRAYRSEHRLRCADGSYLWVLERGRIVERSAQGQPLRMVLTQSDISTLRKLEDNLALWAQVFAAACEGIIVTDASGRIVEVNDAYCDSCGYARAQLIGRNPSMMKSGHQSAEFYRQMWSELRESGTWQGELLNRRADGSFFVQATSIRLVADREGNPTYYVGFTSDVSALRESQQRAEHLRRHDALTGLPNRQQLGEDLRLAIALAERSAQMLAVCALDIDHFKPINERWGPEQGDHLLIEIATRIKGRLHPGDLVARIGGDEFVVLLANLDSAWDCDARIRRFLGALDKAFDLPDGPARLSASVGAALYPVDGDDSDALLRHADQALFAAKQEGGNNFRLFDTEQDRRLRAQQQRVAEVRAALEDGQLTLHYQPKVRFDNGEVIGVEALLRWLHPERGVLRPKQFLSSVSDTALLAEIGEWCLDTALAQAARWHRSGLTIPISVNVAATQILRPGFVSHLKAALERHQEPLRAPLEIEILESEALADIPRVTQVMERCTEMGIAFALDDFGTGYSSLAYLKHLPAATLKIDRSFVRDVLADVEHRAIIEAVLSLCRVFGRRAIAEGVESVEHGVALIGLGASHGQGFAIADALPAEDLPDWIKSWRNPPEWTRASWRARNQRGAAGGKDA